MEKKNLTGYPSIDKPWLKYYLEEAINAPLPECTMYEYIYERNQDNLDHIALNYYGAKLTYGQLFKKISHMAGALEAAGIQEGDVVTIAMINAPDTVCLLFALNKIGAVANMVFGASTPEELKKWVTDAKSSYVFTIDMFQEGFAKIANEAKLKKVIVTNLTESMSAINRIGARLLKGMKPLPLPNDSRFCSWNEFFKDMPLESRTCHDGDALAVITYTGGTTGGSKGAALSNKAVISVTQQYIWGERNLSRNSTWMQVIPLFTAYGVTCSMLIPLAVGMTMIIRVPMSETLAAICKKFKPNHIIYGPAFWEKLADDNEDLDLSYLIAPISGGDTLRASVEAKINDYLTKHGSSYCIMNGYGMSEVGAAVSVNFRHAYEFGSVGTPFAQNIISAFDPETSEELQYEQEGELCLYTPSMMSGYINNKEETDNIIRRHDDGKLWVHSGDLGYITKDGFVHISGRLKRFILVPIGDMYKKVFSLDIEKVLLQHPAIENCAVVPMPTPMGQLPKAFIVLKKEYQDADSPETDIRDFCKERLDTPYLPAEYRFVDKFPLTKIGKVDYLALEREYTK